MAGEGEFVLPLTGDAIGLLFGDVIFFSFPLLDNVDTGSIIADDKSMIF